ncbi:MAG: A/G-specific adenine glycosylase [Terrimonas sp.]|nr:A/G-specific adenine glycosylase [Terrimonas sp.]OJY82563.1 MAG: A/G-specific adenine glycosylase [Sphingobacteriales bacterium 40-81]
MKPFFTSKLLAWNRKYNKRAMPWKGEKDPYKIWLSEIILQQTRVEQGWDYYLRFIEAFPTVKHLATAPEAQVFKLWEGLGYYTRCKNLIATARIIHDRYKGVFPSAYEDILALKGIGPYTAAAIASFAFNLPYAVVDGNVLRVMARMFGIKQPVDSTKGKALLTSLANNLLDKKLPGIYNQAIMDFGAVVCKPKLPLCDDCVMKNECIAYNEGLVDAIPAKEKKIIKKVRWMYYIIITYNNSVYIRMRTGKDIWQNLHEFVLVEAESKLSNEEIARHNVIKQYMNKYKGSITGTSKHYVQQLTHQTIQGRFIELTVSRLPDLGKDFIAVIPKDLPLYAFPKFITTYLQEKNVNLSQH